MALTFRNWVQLTSAQKSEVVELRKTHGIPDEGQYNPLTNVARLIWWKDKRIVEIDLSGSHVHVEPL